MKIDFYTRLSLQIILVFCTAIFVSFIPDSLHGFLVMNIVLVVMDGNTIHNGIGVIGIGYGF